MLRGRSVAVKTGVDLQMQTCGAGYSRGRDTLELMEMGDPEIDICVDERRILLLGGEEPGKHPDVATDALLSEPEPGLRIEHAEPGDTLCDGCLRHRQGTVTVGIRFDDSHQRSW